MWDYGTDVWTTEADYPFDVRDEYLHSNAMLYVEELSAYFIIGGWDSVDLATIAKFANGVWSSAGQLNSARKVSFCF